MTNPAGLSPEDIRYGYDDRYRVRVKQDPLGNAGITNPRTDATNVGTMVLADYYSHTILDEGDLANENSMRLTASRENQQYGTTDVERFESLAQWLTSEHGATEVLAVWAYGYGNATVMATKHTLRFDGPLRFVGVIYDTPAAREKTGVPLDQVAAALAAEVDAYDKWRRGEVYQFLVDRRDENGWNQVGAISGYHTPEQARSAAKAAIESGEYDSILARVPDAVVGVDVAVRAYAAAAGTDDASVTYAFDVLDWTVTLRRRKLDTDNQDAPQTDTVIEISDGSGPVEVIVRGISNYYE